MTQQKQNYALPIIVCLFLFGMIAFVTNLAAPLGEVLYNQFEIARWMGTLGVLANFIAYAVMGYPGGVILDRYGYKKTALIAIAVGFIGVGIQVISGFAGSFGIYILGAFVAGFSMTMLNIVVNPMLNKIGGGGKKSNQLVQLGGSMNSLFGTMVFLLVGILLPAITEAQISDVLPLLYTALAIFGFAFIVIALSTLPEDEKTAAIEEKSAHSPLSFRHFVLGTFAIFCYVGLEVGNMQFINKWLANEYTGLVALIPGIDPEVATTIAGSVAGTFVFLMLVGRLAGIGLASLISPRLMLGIIAGGSGILTLAAILIPATAGNVTLVNMPLFVSDTGLITLGEGLALFGTATVPINALLLVLVGLFASMMWGAIYTLAVEGLGKYTKKASGIFMIMVCGGGVIPLIMGFVLSGTGSFLVSFWVVVAACIYMLYYALVGYKNVNTDIPT